MKYNILINQYSAINSGLNLDIIDLAIFDFIKDFANSPTCLKTTTPQGIYFWVSHKLIIDSMPILAINTTRGIAKRIENLIDAKVLTKHPNCETLGKTLYGFGSNYDLLSFTDLGNEQKFATMNERSTPPRTNVPPPPNERSTDNNNSYNTIIDNEETAQKDFAPLFDEPKNEKKTLFRNSLIYKQVDFEKEGGADFSKFLANFTKEFQEIDLEYYFYVVCDWSDKKDVKRTKNGWLATVRQFIRSDKDSKKLKLRNQPQKQGIDKQAAIDYLTESKY